MGGGDLLHLALILSLLRADVRLISSNLQNRIESQYQIRNRMNPISQKVIDDLSELGQYGYPRPNTLEIAAYVLNTETNLLSDTFTDNSQDNLFNQVDDLFLPPLPNVSASEDLDSGVSDVGQMSDSETDGSRSPDNLNFDPVDFGDLGLLSPVSSAGLGEDLGEVQDEAPLFPDDFDFGDVSNFKMSEPSFDGFDWKEIESVAMQTQDSIEAETSKPNSTENTNSDLLYLDNQQVPNNVDEEAFDWDETEPMDLLEDIPDPFESKSYQPDEEDVENQLIEIDNRLITLDGSIQNLNEGVRHLGEQLATAQTDESVEALLDESFLLATLSDEDPENDLVLGAVGITDVSLNLFDDWPMDVDAALEDILGEVAAEPLPITTSLIEKDEIKTENVTSVPAVAAAIITIKPEDIKQEVESEDDVVLATFDLDVVKKEEEDESDQLFSEIGAAAYSVASHLCDHTYAARADFFPSKCPSEFDYGGASAMSVGSPYSTSSESYRIRESRDERKARQLGIPFSLTDIIDSPMEEFNNLITQTTLTEEQAALCRDIRRRGKNKVAAQNCRRRKLDLISSLEVEVTRARNYKQQLLAEREELYRLRHEWSEKLRHLEDAVLRGLNKDVDQFSLQLTPDGRDVRVTQRHSSRLAKPTRA